MIIQLSHSYTLRISQLMALVGYSEKAMCGNLGPWDLAMLSSLAAAIRSSYVTEVPLSSDLLLSFKIFRRKQSLVRCKR